MGLWKVIRIGGDIRWGPCNNINDSKRKKDLSWHACAVWPCDVLCHIIMQQGCQHHALRFFSLQRCQLNKNLYSKITKSLKLSYNRNILRHKTLPFLSVPKHCFCNTTLRIIIPYINLHDDGKEFGNQAASGFGYVMGNLEIVRK